jgi:hypothetical protein
MKASDGEVIAAYERTNSVWKAATLLGMCGQSVHERLVRLGSIKPLRIFSVEEAEMLRQQYEAAASAGRLADLAAVMGRTTQFICRKARELRLTDPRRRKAYLAERSSAAFKAWRAANEHPRGMLGKKHSDAAKAAISKAGEARWAAMSEDERAALIIKQLKARATANGGAVIADSPRNGVSWKQGWREIGGKRIFCRSSWEANYARYLQVLKTEGKIQDWEHEPRTFWFDGVKRGTVSYLPDFRVIACDGSETWHEIKGWMDARSKTKLARMAKHFPEFVMVVVGSDEYARFRKIYRYAIDGWEEAPRARRKETKRIAEPAP